MKKKLNIFNLIMLIVFIGSLLVIVSDFILIFMNLGNASWTIFGLITFIIAALLCMGSYGYLVEEYIKKEK